VGGLDGYERFGPPSPPAVSELPIAGPLARVAIPTELSRPPINAITQINFLYETVNPVITTSIYTTPRL
jgi:hypothetical protein